MASTAPDAALEASDKLWRGPSLRILSRFGPVMVLLVLLLLFGALRPEFFTPANFYNIARQSAILTILALGEAFIILMGSIDLSVEGVMAVSCVVVSFLVLNARTGYDLGMLGVLVAIAVATFMGFLNGIIHTKLRIPSFMATLGMWSVGSGLATWMYGGYAIRINDPALLGWAKGSTAEVPNLTLFAIAAVIVAFIILRLTRLGRYIVAIGGGEDRAKLAGVPVDKYKVMAFTLAGCFFGIGGVLTAGRLGVGTSLVGDGTMFAAVTAVAVGGTALTGGVGGMIMTLIGALIVAVISNGMILLGVHPFVQFGIQGIIVIIAVALTFDRSKVPIIK